MTPTRQGSFRLFRFGGIEVYLNWSWFLIVLYGINQRAGVYSSSVWCVLEIVALFAIVLLHEFGHALACRQVGGKAELIVLWPFGGVAYVAPPQRPGAMLWSIAAGPLVNVILIPFLTVLMVLAVHGQTESSLPDPARFAFNLWQLNLVLLVFNLLPVYPLDGGQILRSLLWFVLGRARSLMVVVVVGFVGIAGFVVLAVMNERPWLIAMCVFLLLNCWGGLQHARLLARAAKLPRRDGFACPACRQPPVRGLFWRCARCFKPFDTFETGAVCPNCGTGFSVTQCLDCGAAHPMSQWVQPPPVPGPS